MSKQKKKKKLNDSNHVKIGDTILLYYNATKDDKDCCTKDGKDRRKDGYVMTDLSGSSQQQLLLVKPSKKDSPELADIQLGTFKIVCTNNNDAQSRFQENILILKDLQEKNKKLLYGGWDTSWYVEEIKKIRSIIDEADSEVERSKAHVQVEKGENEAKQRQLRGNNMWYGQSIQLRHTLTGKYLCVSTNESSRTENSKLKVYLQRKDSVGCTFRIHPHESVGEEVNYYDQIKFESLAVEGHYLHCSKKTFSKINVTANSECFELNVSAKGSPLQILPYCKTSKDVQEGDCLLKAGGVVRFFNHKHHCYIVGEGSFAGKHCSLAPTFFNQNTAATEEVEDELKEKTAKDDTDSAPSKNVPNEDSTEPALLVDKDDKVIFNDVHFKPKRIKLGLDNPPSTTPNTFWQIEKYSMLSSGEPITWKEECRIKHLPSRRYLAVITDLEDGGYMVCYNYYHAVSVMNCML